MPEGPNTYNSKNPAIAIWQPCLVFPEGPLCPHRRVHALEPPFGVVNVGRVAERVEGEGLEVAAAEGRGRDACGVGGVLAVGQAMLLEIILKSTVYLVVRSTVGSNEN